jgi:hypothetical protein
MASLAPCSTAEARQTDIHRTEVGRTPIPRTEEEILAHIEVLRPALEEARDAFAAAGAAEWARFLAETNAHPIDTLRIGDITVLVPPADAPLARSLFAEAWSERFAAVGSETLAQWTFTFQVTRGDEEPRGFYIESPHTRQIELSPWEARTRGSTHVRSAISYAVSSELASHRIRGWASDDPLKDPDSQRIYRAIAVTPSRATRACLAGDVTACKHALGLDVGEDALDVWYTPEERRGLVLDLAVRSGPQIRGEALDACRESSDPSACDRLLTGDTRRWAPAAGSVRSSLLWLALQRGGTGAWGRLVEDPAAEPEQVLAHVSGMDVDALVSEWRVWLRENRPESYAGLGGKSALALLWTLLFATLATRSTRWRLG